MDENSKDLFKTIRTIVFDMDGVVTSEEDYWLAAELTVLEVLYSDQFIGMKNEMFRTALYKPGRPVSLNKFVSEGFIGLLRLHGINTNWDLAFYSAGLYIIELLFDARKTDVIDRILIEGLNEETLAALGKALPHKRKYLEHINTVSAFFQQFLKKWLSGAPPAQAATQDPRVHAQRFEDAFNAWLTERTGITERLFDREQSFWQLCRSLFQERYLGTTLYIEDEGARASALIKGGLIDFEMPLLPRRDLFDMFGLLKDAGIAMAIATGRPWREIANPLERWGLLHFFDAERIATYRDVRRAQDSLALQENSVSLAKPHPFLYLRALYPNLSDEELINIPLPVETAREVLIVGDTAADMLAAQAIGCLSALVLTGVKDLETAQRLKDMEPHFVLNDVVALRDLF